MKFITQKELSEKMGISYSHIKFYIKKGQIKTKKSYGKLLVESNPAVKIRKNEKLF